MAEGGHFSPIIEWFKENSKALTEQEIEEMKAKFLELEFELHQVTMAEDADLKDLCPDGWSLTRKWALKQALKDYRGMPCTVPNSLDSFSCHILTAFSCCSPRARGMLPCEMLSAAVILRVVL